MVVRTKEQEEIEAEVEADAENPNEPNGEVLTIIVKNGNGVKGVSDTIGVAIEVATSGIWVLDEYGDRAKGPFRFCEYKTALFFAVTQWPLYDLSDDSTVITVSDVKEDADAEAAVSTCG